jgi:hypothetical protein
MAAVMRETWLAKHPNQPVDARKLARQLGIPVRFQRMSAAKNGLQALLIPKLKGGFTIVIDPDPTPGRQEEADVADVYAVRIGHELGHTHFYTRGTPPRRCGPGGLEEERWCDQFSAELLSTTERPVEFFRRLLKLPRDNGSYNDFS